jgi:hypothetical protein
MPSSVIFHGTEHEAERGCRRRLAMWQVNHERAALAFFVRNWDGAPCSSTSSRALASPTPIPAKRPTTFVPRWKSSKTCGRTHREIPTPCTRTTIMAAFPSGSTRHYRKGFSSLSVGSPLRELLQRRACGGSIGKMDKLRKPRRDFRIPNALGNLGASRLKQPSRRMMVNMSGASETDGAWSSASGGRISPYDTEVLPGHWLAAGRCPVGRAIGRYSSHGRARGVRADPQVTIGGRRAWAPGTDAS